MLNAPESPVLFPCGAVMKNRFMLAPLTNKQSLQDGSLSDDEYHWLTMRAKGQFGLVMTCASHVQAIGKGFSGQLGIFSDRHKPGHQRLAAGIQAYGSLAVIQLHHAGMRAPAEFIQAAPVCPSGNEKYGARGLTLDEVKQLRDDFIQAAVRAQRSGYDGVEVHGAHGYILTQFLSPEINRRTDTYGGSLEHRSRILFEIVDGIRQACGSRFLLGVRLSPERFGMRLNEIKTICQRLIDDGNTDFLDLSLWDYAKRPEDEQFQHQSLLEHFTSLDRGQVRLTVAGRIRDGRSVHEVLNAGVDFVSVGQSAILHHDFPARVLEDPGFTPVTTPVTREYLRGEGLGEAFIDYLGMWDNFVEDSNAV